MKKIKFFEKNQKFQIKNPNFQNNNLRKKLKILEKSIFSEKF